MNKKFILGLSCIVFVFMAVLAISNYTQFYYNKKCYKDAESFEIAIKQTILENLGIYKQCYELCKNNGFETVRALDLENQKCICK